MSLLCRLCGERITFDDKHIRQEPHDCPTRREQRQQGELQQTQQKRYYQCNKGCSQEIYFDSNKSQSGKFIPLDKDTGLPHQCPQDLR